MKVSIIGVWPETFFVNIHPNIRLLKRIMFFCAGKRLKRLYANYLKRSFVRLKNLKKSWGNKLFWTLLKGHKVKIDFSFFFPIENGNPKIIFFIRNLTSLSFIKKLDTGPAIT